jgi:hypothetical protein
MELVAQWLKRYLKFNVIWEESKMYRSSTFKLNPEAREVATKFAKAATDMQKEFPFLPKRKPTPPTSAPGHTYTPRNTWVDIAKMKPPPSSSTTAKEECTDDTVTTLSSTRTSANSKSISNFHTIRKNLMTVAIHHKRLETNILENLLDDQRQYAELVTVINGYCARLDELEQARARQANINQAQLRVSLNPEASARDGTLTRLMELLGQDNTAITEAYEILSSPPAAVPISTEETLLRTTISKNQAKYSQLLLDMSKMSTTAPIEDLNMSDLDASSDSDEVSRITDMDTYDDEVSEASHPSTAASQDR